MSTPAPQIGVQARADGSVVVDLNLKARAPSGEKKTSGFYRNLAEDISSQGLSALSSELMQGIDADIQSRQQWVDNYNQGLKLLGMLLEQPGMQNTTNTLRHPLLAWACVKFQAMANGEMLPAGGPAKVKNDGKMRAEVAEALERDLNHYLTAVATEYYPDTDRGLYYIAYGGNIFKKVYTCPLRRRPVSEVVYLPDLIVSNEATDLANARRITHQIEGYHTNDIRKMQNRGLWVDVPIMQPINAPSSTRTAEGRAIGVNIGGTRPQDLTHTLYETYTALDLSYFDSAFKEDGVPTDEEVPYRVTMDRDTRQIYEIVRNWREGDSNFTPRRRFVKWGMVPGIGYLDQGFLNLLGNHAIALTAIERVLIDAGIFSNFPGGVRVKGLRLETNELRPGPGEFPEIDTNGLPINQAIMPLPFKGPGQELLALLQHIEQQGEKVAGTIEIQTAQGTANIPVGTMIAAIEQQSQVMIAVHKRLHNAQKDELMMLRDELVATPDALALLKQADEDQPYTAEQLGSASLVPASDPNIPAHVHRIMQAIGLETLSTSHPDLYNQYEVQKRLLQILRIDDVEEILPDPVPPDPSQVPPDPTAMVLQMQERIENAKLALKAHEIEKKAELDQLQAQIKAFFDQQKLDQEAQDAEAKRRSEERKTQTQARVDLTESEADRESRERIAAMNDQTKLIVEGMRVDQEPTSDDPLRDNKSGP